MEITRHLQVGRLNEEWGDVSEMEYAARVGSMFCAAQIRTSPGHEPKATGEERIFIEFMTSDHKLKASREGSK